MHLSSADRENRRKTVPWIPLTCYSLEISDPVSQMSTNKKFNPNNLLSSVVCSNSTIFLKELKHPDIKITLWFHKKQAYRCFQRNRKHNLYVPFLKVFKGDINAAFIDILDHNMKQQINSVSENALAQINPFSCNVYQEIFRPLEIFVLCLDIADH